MTKPPSPVRDFVPLVVGSTALLVPFRFAESLKQPPPNAAADTTDADADGSHSEAAPASHTDANAASDAADGVSGELDAAVEAEVPVASTLTSVYTDTAALEFEHRRKFIKDDERRAVLTQIAATLRFRGPLREIRRPAALRDVQALADAQPHFAPVINVVLGALLVAQQSGTPPRVPPMLLAGPPGVGKSYFTRGLATALNSVIGSVNYDTGAENSALLGLDKQWASSAHGLLFELICLGHVANPVVVLEEVDKVHRFRDQDPLAALHTLLEPGSAGAVRDLSVDFVFDASHVVWVATANNPERLPPPLLSRFRVFEIETPTAEQAIHIAQQVVATSVAQTAPSNFKAVERRIVLAVAPLTPREIGQAIREAIAAAVMSGRDHLILHDLAPHWRDDTDVHAAERVH